MDKHKSLSHSVRECKYHVAFIPKCRRKTLSGGLRKQLGDVFRRLAEQKGSRIEEGHLMPDHVHMMTSIPPQCAVSQVIGFINGKSAIHLARVYGERKRNFVGQHFGARGYYKRSQKCLIAAYCETFASCCDAAQGKLTPQQRGFCSPIPFHEIFGLADQ